MSPNMGADGPQALNFVSFGYLELETYRKSLYSCIVLELF
jgi:hypothetical protein